jgi:hypothetical protein
LPKYFKVDTGGCTTRRGDGIEAKTSAPKSEVFKSKNASAAIHDFRLHAKRGQHRLYLLKPLCGVLKNKAMAHQPDEAHLFEKQKGQLSSN